MMKYTLPVTFDTGTTMDARQDCSLLPTDEPVESGRIFLSIVEWAEVSLASANSQQIWS
jgi:hypothetical protein